MEPRSDVRGAMFQRPAPGADAGDAPCRASPVLGAACPVGDPQPFSGMIQRLPLVTALRYVQPLREGGSLPAVVDTDDGAWVVKFRGAGQGPKALVAELISAGVARA